MTLDEAIKHAEEIAELNEWFDKNCLKSIQCKECADEHRQLAEWLKELKQLREQTKWIPIGKDFPKTEQYAFITVYNQTKMCWYQNGVFIDGRQNAYTKKNEELVAWMPFQIPKPYKAESEE